MQLPGQPGQRPPRIEVAEPGASEIAALNEAKANAPKSLTEQYTRDLDMCVSETVRMEAFIAALKERIRQLQDMVAACKRGATAEEVFAMERNLVDPLKALRQAA